MMTGSSAVAYGRSGKFRASRVVSSKKEEEEKEEKKGKKKTKEEEEEEEDGPGILKSVLLDR